MPFVQVEVPKMQYVEKRIAEIKQSDHTHNKPVCFFCGSPIKSGEEIISRKETGFYHRKCYEFLFTLKSSSLNYHT